MKNVKTSSWFVKFEARPKSTVRVICCPFAGGGASSFGEWSRGLDPLLELVALQLPGRESRILEPPCETMQAITAALLDETPRLLDKPYIVYGHSMGARVGFELIQGLLAKGLPPPLHFIASAAPAPQMPRKRPAVSHLPNDQFLKQMREYGGIPQLILDNAELLELCLPALRADFKVIEHCGTSAAHLRVPTSIHGGTSDSTVEAADLQAWHAASNVVSFRMHSGGHFFIKQHYGDILREIGSIARSFPASSRYA